MFALRGNMGSEVPSATTYVEQQRPVGRLKQPCRDRRDYMAETEI
jgi:hypothetical protein